MNPISSRPAPDLSAVFDEHFDYIWATLRRLGVRDADREDLVHEVFLKVHARLHDYDASRPLRPWLFGFAYRVAVHYLRLARHRIEVPGRPDDTAAANVPLDEAIAALEERELLLSALHAIDFDHRAVLVMHDIDEIPTHAIARVLDIPLNTVYSRLRYRVPLLGEERDAMWIEALVKAGRYDEARARAAAFRRRSPHSLFSSMVESALQAIP